MTLAISTWSLFHNPKKFDKWALGLSFGFIVLVVTYLYISISYLSQRANEEILVNNQPTDAAQTPVYSQNVKDIKNLTYYINGEAVNLVNGKEEKILAADSQSKQITQYFGNKVEADFNNDGFKDTAFLLTQNSGGTGTFFYVVVALGSKDAYIGTNAILLGDRIAPQTTEYRNGEIIVNYADRKASDSFAIDPSVGVSKYFIIDGNNKLVEKIK